MQKTKINIILPVFNEEQVIKDFHETLLKVINAMESRYLVEVIYVLDKSTDNSLEILKEICISQKHVKLIALSRRFGHQMSLVAGMDSCDGDIVIMMDSDLQHPPSLIPTMVAEFERGYDIVYTIRDEAPQTSLFKRISSKLFYKLINSISQTHISESAADFRLISKKVLRVFQEQIRERNQFLRGLFNWVGFKTTSIHFQAADRPAGASKYNLVRMIRFGLDGIISFSKRPLQAAIYLGFVFATAALLFTLLTFIQYFYYDELPSGWTTLVILISMFSGVQLIFLGIIGEYIAGIFDEVKSRPHYIIEEKVNF